MRGKKWWVVMGYPDFDEGPDGFPRPDKSQNTVGI